MLLNGTAGLEHHHWLNLSATQRISVLLFLAASLPAVYFFNGGGQNQNASFDLTRALVERGEIHIDRFRDNTIDLSYFEGHFYVNKAPGLSFAAAAPYLLARPMLTGVESEGLRLTLAHYLSAASINALALGGIAVLMFLFGCRFGVEEHWSVIVALLVALATPLLPYGTMLFAHVPSAFLYLLAFYLVGGGQPRSGAAGVAVSAAGSMNYVLIPLAILPAGFLWWHKRELRAVGRYLAGALPVAVGMMVYHARAFGSPFRTAVAQTKSEFLTEGAVLGVLGSPSLEALWGITFSPYRGLFFLSPFLLIAVVWIARLPRGERLVAGTVVAAFFLLNVSFNGWHGGYTVGPRYLLPAVPFLGLALLRVDRSAIRFVVLAAGLWGLVLNVAVTAVDPQVPESIENPVVDYVLPTLIGGQPPHLPQAPWLHDFFVGHVGVNRLTVAERQIFRRFPPGSPETEWAAFNLGETLIEPGSLGSLVPFLLIELALIAGLWANLLSRRNDDESLAAVAIQCGSADGLQVSPHTSPEDDQ